MAKILLHGTLHVTIYGGRGIATPQEKKHHTGVGKFFRSVSWGIELPTCARVQCIALDSISRANPQFETAIFWEVEITSQMGWFSDGVSPNMMLFQQGICASMCCCSMTLAILL